MTRVEEVLNGDSARIAEDVAALLEEPGHELSAEDAAVIEAWFLRTWSVRVSESEIALMLRIALGARLPKLHRLLSASRAPEGPVAAALARAVEALDAQREDNDDDHDDYDEEEYFEPASLRLAREALDVGREASPTSVKRAYLRRVKEHRPERDPEGFQRVRQAYDRIRGEDTSDRSAPLPGPAIDPTPAPRPIPISSDPLAPFFARAGRLRAKDPALVDIWREAARLHPLSPRPWQELYNALMAQDEHSEASRTLIAAISAGHAAFLRMLVTAHPASTPPDLLETAARDPDLRAPALHASVEQSRWRRAGRLASEALDDALRSADSSVALEDCLKTLFGLAATGSRGVVRELATKIGAYVEHAPRELQLSGLAAHWAIADELASASTWLKPASYEAMAGALVEEDIATGRAELARLLAKRPALARAILRRAPLLGALFEVAGPTREAEEPPPPREPDSEPSPELDVYAPHSGRPWVAPVRKTVLGLLALCLFTVVVLSLRRAGRDATPSLLPPPEPPRATIDAAEIELGEAGSSQLERAAFALIDYAREHGHRDAVIRAQRLVTAARENDCDTVYVNGRALLLLEKPIPPHDSQLVTLCMDLFDEVKAMCLDQDGGT